MPQEARCGGEHPGSPEDSKLPVLFSTTGVHVIVDYARSDQIDAHDSLARPAPMGFSGLAPSHGLSRNLTEYGDFDFLRHQSLREEG